SLFPRSLSKHRLCAMDRAQEKELKNRILDPNNEVLRMNRRLLRSSRIVAILVENFLWGSGAAHGQHPVPGVLDRYSGHPRAFVISDIGNEPDDQMSFVRFLLYSNEIDVEGL